MSDGKKHPEPPRAKTEWVWIYVADDWVDGPIPAYLKAEEES